ncbi:hypothetical protein MRB53_023430 [Persea americana]|uniref:Uncharacterized protein n=1 Tax=Persea americana TaxID=3435 RepID=A0ACC2LAK7_PERAE|nr:hypothetical protein MRB53_023430 [Persea americana]
MFSERKEDSSLNLSQAVGFGPQPPPTFMSGLFRSLANKY